MLSRFTSCTVSVAILSLSMGIQGTLACPFCTAVANTLSEDIAAVDVAVIARLASPPGPQQNVSDQLANSSLARFAIEKVLKGESVLGTTKIVTAPLGGDASRGDKFLILGTDPPNLSWSPPLRLNDAQHQYLLNLVKLPQEGPERLAFFLPFLESSDTMLSRDAYDEFARTPYAVVKQLKPKMDHAQLVAWIKDPNVPASRRRLYLTMLGVCGDEADLPMLEERLRGADPQSKSGLDALIACYLTLRGPEGVALIEDLFLRRREDNFSSNYADVYAAIMALRFHGIEADIVPRKRVIKAFGYLLDNPQMADLVIPDLARWEDWSQLERLVALFKTADDKTTWVRMPIINFTRACPRPEAEQALDEFRKIDPDAVKRAMTFFPTLPGKNE